MSELPTSVRIGRNIDGTRMLMFEGAEPKTGMWAADYVHIARIATLERELAEARGEVNGRKMESEAMALCVQHLEAERDRLAAENAKLKQTVEMHEANIARMDRLDSQAARKIIALSGKNTELSKQVRAQEVFDTSNRKLVAVLTEERDAALSRLERASKELCRPEVVEEIRQWREEFERKAPITDLEVSASWIIAHVEAALADMEGERAPVVPDETRQEVLEWLDNYVVDYPHTEAEDIACSLFRRLLAALGEDGRG